MIFDGGREASQETGMSVRLAGIFFLPLISDSQCQGVMFP